MQRYAEPADAASSYGSGFMSHNFKRPISIHPQERRDGRQIDFMASLIKGQKELDVLLADAPPATRAAMLDRLRPHLSFVPAQDVTPDCPQCGLRRGSVIAHDCLTETRLN